MHQSQVQLKKERSIGSDGGGVQTLVSRRPASYTKASRPSPRSPSITNRGDPGVWITDGLPVDGWGAPASFISLARQQLVANLDGPFQKDTRRHD